MRYSTQIRPISYLKANAAEVLQVLEEQRKPMIITQNGEAKAVIQDVASYEETQETLALLKILSRSAAKQVERGEVHADRGSGKSLALPRLPTPDALRGLADEEDAGERDLEEDLSLHR